MNIEMYRVFFEIQKKHWWFVSKKAIVLDHLDRFVQVRSDMKYLDIGCGSGLMLDSFGSNDQTSGMDMSDEAISFSKEIFDGVVKRGFLPDNVPFDDNSFDVITALDVIEHVERDQESLDAIYNCLKNGGTAVITVPAYMFLWTEFDEMNEHKRRYTLGEMKTKLQASGFKIEKISYYNTLLFPIVFIVRMFNKIFRRKSVNDVDMPSELINSILKKIFGFEKHILRYSNLPFGVSVIAVVKKTNSA